MKKIQVSQKFKKAAENKMSLIKLRSLNQTEKIPKNCGIMNKNQD